MNDVKIGVNFIKKSEIKKLMAFLSRNISKYPYVIPKIEKI